MARLLLILLAALILEAVGVVLLSRGLKQIGQPLSWAPRELVLLAGRGLTNGPILLGIALEAVFFAALLYLLAKAEVSLVWPLTSLGFVITTLAAWLIGREQVSPLRWTGVLLIVIGAAVVGWSQKQTGSSSLSPGPVHPTPRPDGVRPAGSGAASEGWPGSGSETSSGPESSGHNGPVVRRS